ncbi:MAG TPA: pyridoxamine 5'-phosphate oxidase family protein [Rhodothermales bacterium]|nr:pyridoxamine 5'-phosphate oxidase family protein [Bacteroidota bacterium]HRK73815.1 pyridoxamine 5'-phosphate oxidase family protein [Rhodothermales bacterium]HRR08607.1 pyridoxamine 5'-phosphate oxidase family protein [Rhodothermales bacterium]
MSTPNPKTKRNKVIRVPERGHYDRNIIYPIVDEALIGHVGFVMDEQPIVIPTLIARDSDYILLHGSEASRMMRHMATGAPVCITVTHTDALILARSAFHHSVNYRSAMLFGTGEKVEEPEEKMRLTALFMEKLIPQRWDDSRIPNEKELKATMIVRVYIEQASAKIRNAGVKDDAEDLGLPYWAGILPIQTVYGPAINDELLPSHIPIPEYVRSYGR